jgi:hypothetical protein
MKTLILFLFNLFLLNISFAQQKAVTESGEEVILYNDKTWKYLNDEENKENIISLNSKKFTKDENSTFLLKSKKLNVGFWLDPKVWSFKKSTNNPDAEYEFQLKDGDLYGMVITEKVEIPIETLKSIAFENAKSAAADIKIVKEEYRNVNGLKLLFLQMDGTIQGIKFSYYGYYFSNANGTVQFLTYTSQVLLNTYVKECEALLNGLVVLN